MPPGLAGALGVDSSGRASRPVNAYGIKAWYAIIDGNKCAVPAGRLKCACTEGGELWIEQGLDGGCGETGDGA